MRSRFQSLGLIRESGHAHFVGSVLVPTIDLDGNVTGIYGRKTRDDLNKSHSSPKHLYLPGPDQDVFNEEAFVASKEIVLTEARIDAMSFWRWGIRNVTACRGVHLSDALFSAFLRYGVERCFIAFDRDEAGDAGARKAGEKLMAAGVECYRVLFPKGMDANEVALKMTPAGKTLALFLRSAEWMGNGHRPRGTIAVPEAASPHAPEAPPPAATAASPVAEPGPSPQAEASEGPSRATEDEPGRAAEEEKGCNPASPSQADRAAQGEAHHDAPSTNAGLVAKPAPAPATAPGLTKLTDDEALFAFEDRRYRVRGLKRCNAYGSLRINLKAEREGDLFAPPSPIAGWHMDNLDLCVHRQRQTFERMASHELGVREEVVRFDLGRILRTLEAVQDERIAEATAPKARTVTLTEGEKDEAIAFWKSVDLFGRIAGDYTTCGLVGETVNKIAAYVGGTSRLLDRPLAIIIQSSSAAGKSTLMEKTLGFMPEEMREKYTAVSGKSLFYFDENTVLSHKILAIVEEEGAEKATYPLKILQSEGELVMASTGKDPHSGKLVTKVYKVEGPVMIILTTTSVEVDPELENRCLRLTVDESREQTKAIHELQRMRMTHEGHVQQAERERIQKLHRNAQRVLRRIRVHNPYARLLTFVHDQTRTRRDHDKYLTLIETIALMHQFQRPVYRREVGGVSEEYIDVTLSDVELAGRLIGEIVGQSLGDLQPQTKSFLKALDEMVTKLCEESGVERCDLRFSQRQIRERTGFTEFQVRVHLARLIGLEYVLQHRGSRGHSFVYELVYAGEGRDGKPFVLGLVDVERLRTEEAAAATTSHPRGPEGRSEGYSSPIRAPFEADPGAGPAAPAPAPGAASHGLDTKMAGNALIPSAKRIGSYAPAASGPGPDGHGRLLRINLLKRPAVALDRRARVPA